MSAADTIYALASGAAAGAVAVLRLSGPRTGEAVRCLAGGLPPPRRASLRRLRAPDGETLDHALVLWFPAPASYTGEDAAELHLHGGRSVIAGVMEALSSAGLRQAEPGEFTRLAFLHGKMDLTAAEGIADLIAAETAAQRRQALNQADGGLAKLYGAWAERLARLLAHQEASIEFAEDGLPTDLDAKARAGAGELRAEIEAHLADARCGELLREGLVFAIIGAPNAGKSSLLNALVGREAAIVSARAGTTRDIVEARLDLAGVPVTLSDTAGLREAGDEIEAEGIKRAERRAQEAQLVITLFAADQPPDPETRRWVGPEALVLVNKCDLAPAPASIAGVATMAVSAQQGTGLGEVRDRLAEAALRLTGAGRGNQLTRPRHRAALADAVTLLTEAEGAGLPELAAEALRAALFALGRLTGRVGVEEILDIVFRDFCIGK
ncbi:MAG: tRNA uridine-5-carboxymethylaminomethyl(34) synthesis GTPase MnmE [Roseomonas sp.]|nr:tRNA uridine-5-carboxymethylaminomethyl(34) synthesis GTPase MnmE [Roseomonas sp.]MCA3327075.1 tRNA uridine-5-carboxymethylaminomethyl(34) synthesis GTPase MnmE [Roseomonas sp.]MCA3330987.1 tRNA uridine-5-carboxymethylaminomethyl(34) synthesis GTPase MnmE [Roseomonas sp.]MCA3334071.1 tRNA uridine-5-carboxymethylaminomethyl(34) synthesis GTPase MnmE [Roseomonas sp.]MCA3346093.1 tRNA uridine-5-carboxymethylaminomethyl(34) synthesis GTPase MnmE [Roseomonas sp.]